MSTTALHALLLLSLLSCSSARSSSEWAKRSIYQVVTDRFATSDLSSPACDTAAGKYCGGTFQGLQGKLDYVKGMGFNAIWISPVVENTDNGYHGYWAKNIFSINSHFGTAAELKSLVKACHDADIWVMVDVVANHVGPQSPGAATNDFSSYMPFNSPDHFHSFCEISQNDWDTMNQYDIEHCRLANLPDLNQDNDFVRTTLKKWIQNLVEEFGFDGIRIDTVAEVDKQFWAEFAEAAGVFATGEVLNGDPTYTYAYADSVGSVLDYPLFFPLRDAFMDRSDMHTFSSKLDELSTAAASHGKQGILPAFVDNHDNRRFLCHTAGVQSNDWTLLKNALAVVLLGKHIPVVYYGTEQGFTGCDDPSNREALFGKYDTSSLLYSFLVHMHAARTMAEDHASFFDHSPVTCVTDSPSSVFAASRGSMLLVANNFGSDAQEHEVVVQLPPSFPAHVTFVDLLGDPSASEGLSVENGKVTVRVSNGQPRVLVPRDW
eukprot:CAMPEP_0181310466 /NCGR_PEP_ID=MMETSP1101-20121128/12600_1 /TAXON_ID=46948 /ORGANISM="Rhodomonas abbreviata, Strain Caron Lab Isolate" /LENGTH=489 /DNA_ID=CAMNT_0023417095 /DNA_START=133 /DNA_END=1599 /DNA_ORIENTATION=+